MLPLHFALSGLITAAREASDALITVPFAPRPSCFASHTAYRLLCVAHRSGIHTITRSLLFPRSLLSYSRLIYYLISLASSSRLHFTFAWF